MYGKMNADYQVLFGGFAMILSFRPPKTQFDYLPISLQILGINHRQEPIIITKGLSEVSCDKMYFRIDPEYRGKPGVF